MKDIVSNLNHECINLKEVDVRIDAGSGQIMLIKVIQDVIETLEVELDIVQITEVVLVTI